MNGVSNLYKKLSESNTKTSNHIKTWLSTIAKNELIEFLRKNPDEKRLAYPFRQKSHEIDIPFEVNDKLDNTPLKTSIEKEKLEKGLSTLSEREKDILMTYLLYQSQDNPSKHLPDNEIEKLCNKYGINSDNLRQIKRRALLKLKKECGK